MSRVRFVEPARLEFLAEVVYYSGLEPSLGDRFSSAVEEATALAAAFPLAGLPARWNTRRVIVRNFPFSIHYRIELDGIVIFAVAHHARQPNYWRSRTGLPSDS